MRACAYARRYKKKPCHRQQLVVIRHRALYSLDKPTKREEEEEEERVDRSHRDIGFGSTILGDEQSMASGLSRRRASLNWIEPWTIPPDVSLSLSRENTRSSSTEESSPSILSSGNSGRCCISWRKIIRIVRNLQYFFNIVLSFVKFNKEILRVRGFIKFYVLFIASVRFFKIVFPFIFG